MPPRSDRAAGSACYRSPTAGRNSKTSTATRAEGLRRDRARVSIALYTAASKYRSPHCRQTLAGTADHLQLLLPAEIHVDVLLFDSAPAKITRLHHNDFTSCGSASPIPIHPAIRPACSTISWGRWLRRLRLGTRWLRLQPTSPRSLMFNQLARARRLARNAAVVVSR